MFASQTNRAALSDDLLRRSEARRKKLGSRLDSSEDRSELGQFFTPLAVAVSCFPSRAEMRKYLADIAWETEVWCADNPSHLIHFNGERFLGPYERDDPTPRAAGS